jgi:hypothetical protein
MALPSDLIDLLAEFAATGVEYLLVGGQALALTAEPLDVAWMGAAPARIDLMKGVPGGTLPRPGSRESLTRCRTRWCKSWAASS